MWTHRNGYLEYLLNCGLLRLEMLTAVFLSLLCLLVNYTPAWSSLRQVVSVFLEYWSTIRRNTIGESSAFHFTLIESDALHLVFIFIIKTIQRLFTSIIVTSPQSFIWNSWGQMSFRVQKFSDFRKGIWCFCCILCNTPSGIWATSYLHSQTRSDFYTKNVWIFILSGINRDYK